MWHLQSEVQGCATLAVFPSHKVTERMEPSKGRAGCVVGRFLLAEPGKMLTQQNVAGTVNEKRERGLAASAVCMASISPVSDKSWIERISKRRSKTMASRYVCIPGNDLVSDEKAHDNISQRDSWRWTKADHLKGWRRFCWPYASILRLPTPLPCVPKEPSTNSL